MTMLMMLIGGIGAILLGLPYIFHAFGSTEAEVVIWGRLSLYMGASLILLSLGIGRSNKKAAKVFLSLGYIGLALVQVVPILLWFAFHGSGISDGTPPSEFVAHWLYSLPHAALLVISLMVLYQLWWLPTHAPADLSRRK
jgi:hypothetical protein